MASKTSTIVHKTKKPATDLYQVLGKIEETVQELTRLFAEADDSKHRGAQGMLKLTQKQQLIIKQLELAQNRAESVVKLIEKGIH